MERKTTLKRKPLIIASATLLSVSLALPAIAAADPQTADERADRTAGQVIDDVTIAARLEAALLEDPMTDAIDIDIEVDRDKVQLNGFVGSDKARERAGQLAMQTKGVKSVENNLEVDAGERRTGEYIDDKTLLAKVKTALTKNDIAKAATVDVEVNRGVVSLGGHLNTQRQIDAAVDATENVEGVRDIINNLEVRSTSS
jgi:hyperosmotically inducible protein